MKNNIKIILMILPSIAILVMICIFGTPVIGKSSSHLLWIFRGLIAVVMVGAVLDFKKA